MPDPASLCLTASMGAFVASVAVAAWAWLKHRRRLQEREQEARRIEDKLNPIIDKLSEEMGHQMPHVRIEWED